ncbi:MAG TPA: hypothetical protein VHZ24_16190 [Pirellulales bacterium]|jgi:hypothetical protein|nr:hypothetical protein [Pirellulales bacterium]
MAAFFASPVRSILATAVIVASSTFGSVDRAAAAAPRVQFDTATVVECRDVTPPSAYRLSPNERLYEAQFNVSMLLTAGSEDDLKEMLLFISSPERRLRVVDFFPRNELASDITGPIERKETTERTTMIEFGPHATVTSGPVQVQGTPGAAAQWTKHTGTDETYHKLPPKKLIVASGTTGNGSGVFFKLHPSTQDSLQGAHSFRVTFAAPADWRFDRVKLRCEARGYGKVLFVKQEELAGATSLTVGLHRSGDVAARQAAYRVAESYRVSSGTAQQAQAAATRRALMFE